MTRTIAITGATGLLGSHLAAAFAERGWNVRAGVRRPQTYAPPGDGVSPFQCELPGGIDPTGLEGVDVLLHAAYDTKFRSKKQAVRVNYNGTRELLRLADEAEIPRRVFISSCSAHPLALSFYGRSKLALEKEFRRDGDLILRPGLIVASGGLFGRMADTVRKSRIVPLFDGGKQVVQTIHIDDVCEAIVRAVERDETGRFVLAETDGISMRELMRLMAEAQDHRPLFVSVPSLPVLACLKIAEMFRIPLPVSSENLLGLRSMVHQDARPSLDRLGVSIRPARESIRDILSR
ncbi:NAD(P)-dependent oxidoreductase [bacterium]|nr:NAD(P)-dependent oxidoreductase [bacterium]